MNNNHKSLIDELKELTLTKDDLKELTKNQWQDLHLKMIIDFIDICTKHMTIEFAKAKDNRNHNVIEFIYFIQEEKIRLAKK
jgi:hypothetical protein